ASSLVSTSTQLLLVASKLVHIGGDSRLNPPPSVGGIGDVRRFEGQRDRLGALIVPELRQVDLRWWARRGIRGRASSGPCEHRDERRADRCASEEPPARLACRASTQRLEQAFHGGPPTLGLELEASSHR